MRLFKIIIIGFFIVTLTSLAYSDDLSSCNCPSNVWKGNEIVSVVVGQQNSTTSAQWANTRTYFPQAVSTCIYQTSSLDSFSTVTKRLVDLSTNDYSTGNSNFRQFYSIETTRETNTCCTDPDTDTPPPLDLDITDISINSCASPDDNTNALQECSALGGSFYPVEKRKCCDISSCFVTPSDDNETGQECEDLDPAQTSGYPLFAEGIAENTCNTGVPSGDARWVMLDFGNTCCFRKDTNDTCPDTFVCMGTSYNPATNIYTNIYDVLDCNGIDYAERVIDESFSCYDVNNTNPTICPEGQTKDNDGNCQIDANNDGVPDNEQDNTNDTNSTDPCNYPLVYNEKQYKGMSFSYDGCVPYYNDLGFEAEYLKNDDCSNGACYKGNVLPTDNNTTDDNTDDSNNDNNTTGDTDNNTTVPKDNDSNSTSLDFSTLENKLDAINNSINANSEVNHNDLTKVDGSINTMNSNLGDKLDGIKNTILGTSDGERTDMSETNGHLKDIKDKLSGEVETDTTQFDNSLANAKNVFSDAMASFSQNALDLRSLASGVTAPRITASGSCILSGTTAHIGSFQFDFSKVSVLRLPLQFVLNLYLVLFTFKLYTRIARDIASYLLRG